MLMRQYDHSYICEFIL